MVWDCEGSGLALDGVPTTNDRPTMFTAFRGAPTPESMRFVNRPVGNVARFYTVPYRHISRVVFEWENDGSATAAAIP